MSTKITKTGILIADGSGIGENLILNTLPTIDGGGWSNTSSFDYTIKDGSPCIHFTGAFTTTKNAGVTFTDGSTSLIPSSGDVYIFGGEVLFENVVKGTKNYFVTFYRSGSTIDGVWRNASMIANSGHFTGDTLNPDKLNGMGWTRAWMMYRYGNYAWTAHGHFLYARDFTGDVYFKNIFFKKVDIVDPWIPSIHDNLYVGPEIGFDEESFEGNARIASGYMQAREFYED